MSSLVILAAGVGSRYGKMKQLDAITEDGNQIIDFTIYDAIQAGFKKLYLIIQPQHETLFEEKLVQKIRHLIEVEYIYQTIPEDIHREKPLGTGYALYCCKDQVKEPFVICNADDYYGKDVLIQMIQKLQMLDSAHACMAGYILKNTLSENGSVSRGLCQIQNGLLESIVEMTSLTQFEGKVHSGMDGKTVHMNDIVSMNFWGLHPEIFKQIEPLIHIFLEVELKQDMLKKECYIPSLIQSLITSKVLSVEVFVTESQWMGVTYRSDKQKVVNRISEMVKSNSYPEHLWQ